MTGWVYITGALVTLWLCMAEAMDMYRTGCINDHAGLFSLAVLLVGALWPVSVTVLVTGRLIEYWRDKR